MNNSTDSNSSRRQWLLKVPLAFAGSSLAVNALAKPSMPLKQQKLNDNFQSPQSLYDVRVFGAKGDGRQLDTEAIQKAIDTCHAKGGGTVLFPPGVYLSGTIELKSHVTIHLGSGATLLGSTNGNDYHAVDAVPLSGDTTLRDGNWALIYAVSAENIAIEGRGTIDGQGASFKKNADGSTPPNVLLNEKRPYHFLAYQCKDISVGQLSLVNCAYHSIRIVQSTRINISDVYVHNRVNVNNDGFHFISSKHVTIANCTMFCQDDACAFFGSCEFLTVTNSTFSTRWSVFRFGGGKTKNVTVSNCIFSKVYGCPIKFQGSPGSGLENASFSNLIFEDVTGPIFISCGWDSKNPNFNKKPTVGNSSNKPEVVVRNISFNNISGTIAAAPRQLPDFDGKVRIYPGEEFSCITISSSDNALVENISLTDIRLKFDGGGTKEAGKRRDLPQSGGAYFSMGTMPAYALYARLVQGLTLQNIRFDFSANDLRPAMIFDQVTDAVINNTSVKAHQDVSSAIRIVNSKDCLINSPRLLSGTKTYLAIEGRDNRNIVISGGDLSKSKIPVSAEMGASLSMVTIK